MLQQRHISLICAPSQWVETHIGRVIYLEELAKYSGCSLWHMQKIFKETTGVSLGKYIRERRLAGAAYQLRYSDITIFDIALDFGFGTQSHFTYMLRKQFDITPCYFRYNLNIQLNIKPSLHFMYQRTA